MKPFDYVQPKDISELMEALQTPGCRILAGGTDLLPRIHSGDLHPSLVVDISMIKELAVIEETPDSLVIGALATFSSLLKQEFLQQYTPSLSEAIRLIGAPMTRARGTIGGNIANASPAGDTLTPLLTYDARISLLGKDGTRVLPLQGFLLGPGQNALLPGEIIQEIVINKPSGRWGSSFQKLGPRTGMTIAIVNTAVFMVLDQQGRVSEARLALGAVAPTPLRCKETEKMLQGAQIEKLDWEALQESIQLEIKPIDDLRGTKTYRNTLVKTLIKRAILDAYGTAKLRALK